MDEITHAGMRGVSVLVLASLIAVLGCVSSSVTSAQTAIPPRQAIPFPDTAGANFAIGDSATGTATPADFDFLVGVWRFEFQVRRPDGTFTPSWAGHWFVQKKRNPNAFIEDHFRPDRVLEPFDRGTWTYRVFNPARKLWTMQGVESEMGVWAPGLCWSDVQDRYVVQWYGSAVMRIKYFAITDTSFLWRADRSEDAGKTWIRDWWTMRAERVSR